MTSDTNSALVIEQKSHISKTNSKENCNYEQENRKLINSDPHRNLYATPSIATINRHDEETSEQDSFAGKIEQIVQKGLKKTLRDHKIPYSFRTNIPKGQYSKASKVLETASRIVVLAPFWPDPDSIMHLSDGLIGLVLFLYIIKHSSKSQRTSITLLTEFATEQILQAPLAALNEPDPFIVIHSFPPAAAGLALERIAHTEASCRKADVLITIQRLAKSLDGHFWTQGGPCVDHLIADLERFYTCSTANRIVIASQDTKLGFIGHSDLSVPSADIQLFAYTADIALVGLASLIKKTHCLPPLNPPFEDALNTLAQIPPVAAFGGKAPLAAWMQRKACTAYAKKLLKLDLPVLKPSNKLLPLVPRPCEVAIVPEIVFVIQMRPKQTVSHWVLEPPSAQ